MLVWSWYLAAIGATITAHATFPDDCLHSECSASALNEPLVANNKRQLLQKFVHHAVPTEAEYQTWRPAAEPAEAFESPSRLLGYDAQLQGHEALPVDLRRPAGLPEADDLEFGEVGGEAGGSWARASTYADTPELSLDRNAAQSEDSGLRLTESHSDYASPRTRALLRPSDVLGFEGVDGQAETSLAKASTSADSPELPLDNNADQPENDGLRLTDSYSNYVSPKLRARLPSSDALRFEEVGGHLESSVAKASMFADPPELPMHSKAAQTESDRLRMTESRSDNASPWTRARQPPADISEFEEGRVGRSVAKVSSIGDFPELDLDKNVIQPENDGSGWAQSHSHNASPRTRGVAWSASKAQVHDPRHHTSLLEGVSSVRPPRTESGQHQAQTLAARDAALGHAEEAERAEAEIKDMATAEVRGTLKSAAKQVHEIVVNAQKAISAEHRAVHALLDAVRPEPKQPQRSKPTDKRNLATAHLQHASRASPVDAAQVLPSQEDTIQDTMQMDVPTCNDGSMEGLEQKAQCSSFNNLLTFGYRFTQIIGFIFWIGIFCVIFCWCVPYLILKFTGRV